MISHLDRKRRLFPLILGVLTLVGVAVLLFQDTFPRMLPGMSHGMLEASSLALIGIAYLTYQAFHRPSAAELAKAIMVAAAFLFWAANQVWRNPSQAILFDDIAIGLFIFDLFLVIAGWPPTSIDRGFAEVGMKELSGTAQGKTQSLSQHE